MPASVFHYRARRNTTREDPMLSTVRHVVLMPVLAAAPALLLSAGPAHAQCAANQRLRPPGSFWPGLRPPQGPFFPGLQQQLTATLTAFRQQQQQQVLLTALRQTQLTTLLTALQQQQQQGGALTPQQQQQLVALRQQQAALLTALQQQTATSSQMLAGQSPGP
jgi:hypothetical protein